jgi:hypothetical protein
MGHIATEAAGQRGEEASVFGIAPRVVGLGSALGIWPGAGCATGLQVLARCPFGSAPSDRDEVTRRCSVAPRTAARSGSSGGQTGPAKRKESGNRETSITL